MATMCFKMFAHLVSSCFLLFIIIIIIILFFYSDFIYNFAYVTLAQIGWIAFPMGYVRIPRCRIGAPP